MRNGAVWMIDNGMWTGKWTETTWLRELEKFRHYRSTCVGVVIPDKLGDWQATNVLFEEYAPAVRDMGYRVAYVAQNGITIPWTPWGLFDTLFVGGPDSVNGRMDRAIVAHEAFLRGLWVHVGRINSGVAMAKWPNACSYDGTTLAKHPTYQLKRIMQGINQLRAQQKYQLGLFADEKSG